MSQDESETSEKARLKQALGLKSLVRSGWTRFPIHEPESVAAHSWGMGLAALLYCPDHLDREKVITLALIHDLAEVIAGDVTPYDGVSEEDKRRAEENALAEILRGHPRSEELQEWWLEFEDRTTPEGCFVSDLDRLDIALQSEIYEEQTGLHLSEFRGGFKRLAENPDLSHFCDE